MFSYDAYRQSADTRSPTHHATPNIYYEIAAYQTEYGDSAFSPLPMFPSMNTMRKIAYNENLIGPFSICYAADIELCQQQQ